MDQTLRTIITAYDNCALEYLERARDRRPRDAARRFARIAGENAVVLDVASGPGVDVRLLRDVGLRAASGDLSLESMKAARTFTPKGLLAQWDFRRLPFANNTFQGIWAPAALIHLPRREMIPVLKEFVRVQAAGPIFITFPEGEGDLVPLEDGPAGTVPATHLHEDELRALLMRMGYVDVDVESRPDLHNRQIRWVYGFGTAPTTPAED